MPTGHIEVLKRGFRVAVYAGKDPITGRKTYLKESHPTRDAAIRAKDRLVAQVEADRIPDQAATLGFLLDRWAEVADHEGDELRLHPPDPQAGAVRHAAAQAPARVDILDRLCTHLRRCSAPCDSQPRIDHRGKADPHDCEAAGCRSHVCKPMSPGAVRRVHAILSAALNFAMSWGWIDRNPAQHAHPPKLARRRSKPPEPALVAELIDISRAWVCDGEFGLYLWLALTTGARRGELPRCAGRAAISTAASCCSTTTTAVSQY